MAKQWVDITTIDNNTPFMKVRWKSAKWKNNSGPDCWFAEAPGLVTDNMSWSNGTKEYGWFSAHRMNGGGYLGYPIYGCSFNFDHTQSGFWDVSGIVYQDHIKDARVSLYYDTTVEISGVIYYEVDFSLWVNASGYNLYMPYSNPLLKWSAGDVFVEIGSDPIVVDKDNISFQYTGGSTTIEVTAEDNWTASASTSWISLSSDSGVSGTSVITVSAPDYETGTENRTGTIVFECGDMTVTVNVKQYKKTEGIANIYSGDIPITGLYLGDTPIIGLYLGDTPIF